MNSTLYIPSIMRAQADQRQQQITDDYRAANGRGSRRFHLRPVRRFTGDA